MKYRLIERSEDGSYPLPMTYDTREEAVAAANTLKLEADQAVQRRGGEWFQSCFYAVVEDIRK